MVCPRCRGFLVWEVFDDLNIDTDSLHTGTRCINCGCIEDAVVRANRVRLSVKTRGLPRGVARKGDGMPVMIHAEEYASVR